MYVDYYPDLQASGRTNWYDVETGRRDGVISRASEAKSNLPAPDVPVPKAVSMFNVIGLSVEDFVLLMGKPYIFLYTTIRILITLHLYIKLLVS